MFLTGQSAASIPQGTAAAQNPVLAAAVSQGSHSLDSSPFGQSSAVNQASLAPPQALATPTISAPSSQSDIAGGSESDIPLPCEQEGREEGDGGGGVCESDPCRLGAVSQNSISMDRQDPEGADDDVSNHKTVAQSCVEPSSLLSDSSSSLPRSQELEVKGEG